MEQRIINIILRWLWLLILATLGAGLASFWYGTQQAVVYEASVRLIVGPGVDGLSPDLNDLRAGAQLMETYSELATTRPILQAVIEDIGLEFGADRLRQKITVRVNGEAQILSIFVRDEDAVRSAAIANSLANVLLRLSPSGGESPAALLMSQIRTQIATIEETIVTTEARIGELEDELDAATTAEEQQQYIDQIALERGRLAESRATLAVLLESLINTPTNQVKIVEPAIVGEAVSQSLPLLVLVGSAAGLLLATLTVFAYEYLDNSVGNADELEETAGVTVMSTVVLEDAESFGEPESLVVRSKPQSSTAEEYRRLVTKLPIPTHVDPSYVIFVGGLDSKIGTLGANEVAANLAIVLARTGLQVLFVDANFTHPTAHSQFDVPASRSGLTDLLHNKTSSPQIHVINEIPGLSVLTSGRVTYDAFTDLASPRIRESIEELGRRVDVVVIASPPLSVAASLFLASHADGVILVAERGQSSYGDINEALSNLHAIDVKLIGIVLAARRFGTPIWLRKLGRRFVAVIKRIILIVRSGLSRLRGGLVAAFVGAVRRARQANVQERASAFLSRWGATVRKATDSVAEKIRPASTLSGSERAQVAGSEEDISKDETPDGLQHGSDTPVEKTADGTARPKDQAVHRNVHTADKDREREQLHATSDPVLPGDGETQDSENDEEDYAASEQPAITK